VRIAENRVNKILDPRSYEYTKEDVEKIFAEIEEKVKEIKSMFQESSPGKKRFKLAV
jgi:hypothetical protein